MKQIYTARRDPFRNRIGSRPLLVNFLDSRRQISADSVTEIRPKILATSKIERVIYMHAHVYDPIELTRR